jgi:hypothetical protein
MTPLLRAFEARQCRFPLPYNSILAKPEWCRRRRFETSTNSESIESEITPPQHDEQISFAERSAAGEEYSSITGNKLRTHERTAGLIRFVTNPWQDEGQRQAEETQLQDREHSNQDSHGPSGTYTVMKDENVHLSQPMGGYKFITARNYTGKRVQQYVLDTEPPKWAITSRESNSILWPQTSTKWNQQGFTKNLSPATYGDLPSGIHDAEKYDHYKGYRSPDIDGSRSESDTNGALANERALANELMDNSAERAAFQRLRKSLRMRDSQECFMALVELSTISEHDKTASLLLQISPNTFSEILRLVDPTHFLGRHGELRREFSPHYTRVLRVGTTGNHGFHQFYLKYLDHIYRIFVFRRLINPDQPPTLSDYKMLLKAARWTGNRGMANSTWKSLVKNHFSVGVATRVVPDTECFNHYLATLCWSDILNPLYAHQLRTVPSNLQPRTWNRPPRTLAGHRVGPIDGIKVNVSNYFREMAELGLVADVQTLCILMVASGREADLPTAAAILKRVWNIDVEKIMSNQQPQFEPIEGMTPDSALYPSVELLRTIAHIYGINSEIPTAMRLVDYVSRAYSIQIPSQVWFELLQWTHVLVAKRRGSKAINYDSQVGRLPPTAVSNVWSIMTSEPYNIKPGMEMYDLLIGVHIMNERFGEAQARMQEALALHKRDVNILKRHSYLLLMGSRNNPNSMVTAKHQRDYNFRLLRVKRNREYIRLWLARLIKKGGKSMVNSRAWRHRNMPDLVKQWISFSSQSVCYPIDTGFVELHTGARTRNRLRITRREFVTAWKKQHRKKSLQRFIKSRWPRPDSNVVFPENGSQNPADQIQGVDESSEVW